MSLRPDLLLYGGQVLTIDPALRLAEAVAVADDRILAVGTSADIRRLENDDTRLVDLHGRPVVPGLIDAHQANATDSPHLAPVSSLDPSPRVKVRNENEH